jgi:hypothetical protein
MTFTIDSREPWHGLASTCVVQAQVVTVPSELPAESPSPAKKHRHHRMAEAAASPAEKPAAPAVAGSPEESPTARPFARKQTLRQHRVWPQVPPLRPSSGSVICSNLRVQSARRLPEHLSPVALLRRLRHQVAGMDWYGSIPRHTFIIKRALVFTARLRRAST